MEYRILYNIVDRRYYILCKKPKSKRWKYMYSNSIRVFEITEEQAKATIKELLKHELGQYIICDYISVIQGGELSLCQSARIIKSKVKQ